MSAIYYVIDPNGDIYSEDKKVRYTILKGEAAYVFLKSKQGKNRYFIKTSNEDEMSISMEIPRDMVAVFRSEKNHSDYLKLHEYQYQTLSLDVPISEEDDEPLVSQIADPDEDVFAKVARKETIESVRKALKVLTEKELLVIVTMYLGEEELSERAVAEVVGMPYMTVHDTKIRAFKKLRNFFEKVPCKM